MDGRFQKEHSADHYPYLIGTAKNRHRGPLSRSGSDVPAQQLSRYAGAAAWPARGRADDNLQAAGQPNSRVSARRCIQGPAWVRQGRDRAREVERWRRTCAAAPAPPPKSSQNLCPGWKPVRCGVESNHAARSVDRDRCTAVDMPKDGSPDALSARQAYGKPPYHGPVAGRQAVAHGARRERAPLARSAAQPPATLPAGSPPSHPPTQLPLCARRARAVTPTPTWPG